MSEDRIPERHAPQRSRLREAVATLSGFALALVVYTLPFWCLGFFAVGGVLSGNAHELFSFGPVVVPKFMGAGVTNLDVAIISLVGITALTFAIGARYFHHRAKLEALRRRGVTDFDGDGRQDRFTDRFLDDL